MLVKIPFFLLYLSAEHLAQARMAAEREMALLGQMVQSAGLTTPLAALVPFALHSCAVQMREHSLSTHLWQGFSFGGLLKL